MHSLAVFLETFEYARRLLETARALLGGLPVRSRALEASWALLGVSWRLSGGILGFLGGILKAFSIFFGFRS